MTTHNSLFKKFNFNKKMKDISKLVLLFFLLGNVNFIKAQVTDICKELLEQKLKIDLESDIREELYKLSKCSIDSIDVDVYYVKLVGNFILTDVKNTEVSIREIYDEIVSIRDTQEFITLKEVTMASKKLSNLKINLDEWDEIKILLKKIEVPNSMIDRFYEFLNENNFSDYTYIQAFDKFMNDY